MPAFSPGEVVIAWIPDPDGRPVGHPHTAMVLRADGTTAMLVAISSKFSNPPPSHWIRMEWHRARHPVTGLDRPCVAKCDWVVRFPENKIVKTIGVIPTKTFAAIVEEVKVQVARRKR